MRQLAASWSAGCPVVSCAVPVRHARLHASVVASGSAAVSAASSSHAAQPSGALSPLRTQQQHSRSGVPAVAHAHEFARPLTAPVVEPSHTSLALPLGVLDLFGNYSIQGPALIRKVGSSLVALVRPGGVVSMLTNTQEGPVSLDSASLSHDANDEAPAACVLGGQHLMLDGSFILQGEHSTGLQHNGKTILSASHLSEDFSCEVLPGGSISHPVNVCPTRPAP